MRVVFAALAGLTLCATAAQAQQKFVSIGTGGVTGVYYPTGGAVCRLVNASRKEHGIRCSAESTGGSIYNINTIRAGELEFGVAQSDWQHHAFNGTSKFEEQGKFEDLRAVFSIHPEPATILARADANVAKIQDLKGKRVNIGNPGSGQRATWEVIETALGWTRDDLSLAAEMKPAETGQALCDNKIDAYFYTVGHPSALIQETLATCDSNIVEVSGEAIDKLVADNAYYRSATIAAGIYGGNPDVTTFGVGATLVSSAQVPEEVVYTLVKAVFENFDQFKALHPAFAHLKEEEMIKDGLSAPLHDGAVKYYTERGWM
ncbi:MAG: TAXI family TRAP transporter solute-binding subunit [Hyphomicrobiales bacterium]|nr:TAXI family TRAP transporter solute-binding subunit [Hyphomicrobiales bacterium]